MEFENSQILNNSRRSNINQDIRQGEQIEDDNVIVDNHFVYKTLECQVTSDTCTAKGTFYDVVKVYGEEATDIQQRKLLTYNKCSVWSRMVWYLKMHVLESVR